jgi:hypothetical protein
MGMLLTVAEAVQLFDAGDRWVERLIPEHKH